MALWPHQHLLQALEHYWNICSKHQLTLREFPDERSHLVTRKSELQLYRSELASIQRVIRLVTDIWLFGPVTSGFRAYSVQACFCDEMFGSDRSKQFAAAVIDDITEQLRSCDAALRNNEANRALLAIRQPSTPATASARQHTGIPGVCPTLPCIQHALSARPCKATASFRVSCHYLIREFPSKRNRSASSVMLVRRRRRYRSGIVTVPPAAAHRGSTRRSIIGRSRFPFNPGISLPWLPAIRLHPIADNKLGNPTFLSRGGPVSRCSSGHADMAVAIESLRHLAVSSATSLSKDANAAEVHASSRDDGTSCDEPMISADVATRARDASASSHKHRLPSSLHNLPLSTFI